MTKTGQPKRLPFFCLYERNVFGGMFWNCHSFTSLDLSMFDTKNVWDMSGMFAGCSRLTSLDLSSFNTENVSYMGWMFKSCSSLKSIKLGAKSGLTNKSGHTSDFKSIVPKANAGESIDYTGKWTKSSPYNHADSISGKALERGYASGYGSFEPATYVWEINGQNP